MLGSIGVKTLDDLFKSVPEKYRYPKLNLPPALTEMEILNELNGLAESNATAADQISFLGAGAYHHYVPSAVDAITSRGEFLTAYTPYQPEVSQGTLQAIFEFQTLMVKLTGMDVSNASHYDGATAVAEAAVLAYHNFRGKRSKIIVSPAVNPQYRAVLRTYMSGYANIKIVGDESANPLASPNGLLKQVDQNTSLVIVQYPDFFGRLFDYSEFVSKVHESGALVCITFNPTALGLFKTPGDFKADIAVGEGQPLGIPLQFGGPYLGIFTTTTSLVRKLAGRLVGETEDAQGRKGYVLTLTAREQHIRREKATSNICTNQGLMALTATVYLSLLGKAGFAKVADLCYQKAHYAAKLLKKIKGYKVVGTTPFFHEFVVECPMNVDVLNDQLRNYGIQGGYNLENDYPELKNHVLFAVTEMNTREEIDLLAAVLDEVANG